MMPLVSVIIPTFNRPEQVRLALTSVRDDDYRHKEIIVVDDCSDTFPDFIRSEFPEVKLYRTERRTGVGNARNVGLYHSQGRYVSFLDDDDICYPTKLSVLTETAERTGSGFVFGRTIKKFIAEQRDDVLIPEESYSNNGLFGSVPHHDFLLRMPTHNNGVLLRREDIIQVGGYSENIFYFDDWAGWLKMLAVGTKPVFLDEEVAEFRYHSGGLSDSVNSQQTLTEAIVNLLNHALIFFSGDWKSRSIILALLHDVEENNFRDYDHYVAHVLAHREKYFKERQPWNNSFSRSEQKSLHQELAIEPETIRTHMVDPPEIEPRYTFDIDQVGIVDQNLYLTIAGPTEKHQLHGRIDVTVNLPARYRGVHMSRMVGEIDRLTGKIWLHPLDFVERLKNAVIRKQHGRKCSIDLKLWAPITIQLTESQRSFTQQFLINCGISEHMFFYGLTVPHMTACPCVQCYTDSINENSVQNLPSKITHSQRAESTLKVWAQQKDVLTEFNLLDICHQSLIVVSDMLRREDEFNIVYRAHHKPQFIEDCVRELAHYISTHPSFQQIQLVEITSRSFESIHSRDITASLKLKPQKGDEIT